MKTLPLFLVLVLFSPQVYALSDLERGIMWYGNSVSMGTYIAEMEGKIARMKLEFEKKAATSSRLAPIGARSAT